METVLQWIRSSIKPRLVIQLMDTSSRTCTWCEMVFGFDGPYDANQYINCKYLFINFHIVLLPQL